MQGQLMAIESHCEEKLAMATHKFEEAVSEGTKAAAEATQRAAEVEAANCRAMEALNERRQSQLKVTVEDLSCS